MARAGAPSDSGRMKQIRVLLVDDSVEFLKSASDFLSRDPRVLVVGQAYDGAEGVRLAEALVPDLVLMDLAMPGMSGLAATCLMKLAWPTPPRVVIVTMHDSSEHRKRAADTTRADAFICKEQFAEAVTNVIETLFNRPAVFGPTGSTL